MPDKSGGWRKKIHAARPKDSASLKSGGQETTDAGDTNERRRRQTAGWRKTIHGSRPQTPANIIVTPSADEDLDDTRSEHGSEASTPRRIPRPKLSRYISKYGALKDASKEPEFSEPWKEDTPLIFTPFVDPLIVLQSIHSYIINVPYQPLPPQHNSGIFQIFEDYKKVRNEKERLDGLIQESIEGFRKAEESWCEVEGHYQAEIRRLELLVARGASGMTGLMRARQESVVKRERPHRQTIAKDRIETASEFLAQNQLDERIRLASQKVLLHRPSSPSNKMAALSRRFSTTSSVEDFLVGTPPTRDRQITLSRKDKSELDLAKLSKIDTSNSVPRSVYSGFSENGDPLPDEAGSPSTTPMDPAVECDAIVALQELGTLVARRKGICIEKFLKGLMLLFLARDEENGPKLERKHDDVFAVPYTLNEKNEGSKALTPTQRLHHFQSQPHLGSKRRQRHFSFEPGDDTLAPLEDDIMSHARNRFNRPDSETDSSDLKPLSPKLQDAVADLQRGTCSRQSQTLSADFHKPSKIPSPVQTLGRVRRENSTSSLQTVFSRPYQESRRDSKSSILTAFRENPGGNLQPLSKSRSSSINNLQDAQHPKDQTNSLRTRNSIATLAAARAADQADNMSHSKSSSETGDNKRNSSFSSLTETICASGRVRSENDAPQECS